MHRLRKRWLKEFASVPEQISDFDHGNRRSRRGTEEKPVGTVFIALADNIKTEHRKLHLPGDRQLIRWRASQAALDLLRRRLI